MERSERLRAYGASLVGVAITLVAVGVLLSSVVDLPTAILLYVVPVVLAASRWGRGPAIAAVVASLLGHDLLFVEPRGTFSIARADETLGLVLLLFTAVVTAQLADAARRGTETAREAAVARRSDEVKTALLRAVTHNLRTPLASIKACVSALRQTGASYSEDDRSELLAEIEEEADRLDRLVTNLLDVSRVEAGVLHPRKRVQDVGELLVMTVRRLQPLAADRAVDVELKGDLPLVAFDYAQIDQVVTNLLENAFLHTPPETPVVVRAVIAKDEQLRIEVEDQGTGLAAQDRERLFRPFERGSTTAAGSGLGLAIARGFVDAHGGRLWWESVPGGGSRFVFTLPAAPEAPT